MCIIIIGDAFVDIIVPVVDIKEGETYHRPIGTFIGGSANIAIQISKLDENVTYIGKIGKDTFGKYISDSLKEDGVGKILFEDPKNPTGICTSLVSEEGERTMIAMRGANDHLSFEEISSQSLFLSSAKSIFFSGYSILSTESLENMKYIFKTVAENNCKVYFNPGASNIITEDFKLIIKDFVDVLFLNFAEAKKLSGEKEVSEIIEKLKELTESVIVTMGSSGCIISTGNGYQIINTAKIKISDSTGAGDSFISGFIVGENRGLNSIDCAKLGNLTALNFLKEKNKG